MRVNDSLENNSNKNKMGGEDQLSNRSSDEDIKNAVNMYNDSITLSVYDDKNVSKK